MRDYGPLRLKFADNRDWTLSAVLGIQAARYADKVFLVQPGRAAVSYHEMDDAATVIAHNLIARGFRSGDRLMLLADNCYEYIQAWFGAARAGVVEVPTNTGYFGDFLRHALDVTAPKGVLVDSRYAGRFADIAGTLGTPAPLFFLLGDDVEAATAALARAGLTSEPFQALLRPAAVGELPRIARWDLGAIIFTSGTTGPSKGVMMSNAQCHFGSEQCVNQVRLTEDDVYLTANPLFHFNAQLLTTYPTLIAGATMYLYEKFSPSRFSERAAESRATVTNFVGVMMDWVVKQPPSPSDSQSRLRCIFSAPTPWDLVPEVKERFGVETVVEGFGHTETCLPVMTPYGAERPRGAAGLAVSEWYEVRLADPDTDEPVAPGQVGEMQLRPRVPWIINSGYFGMPEATAQARRNMWFHTGDGLIQDEDGWFYFVDRFKDCLRRRGENISSFEVEQPILTHPAVLSCAAIGVPADGQASEDEVCVFVVARDGMEVAAEEISEWAAERLPAFCQPRYVRVMEELPMTPSGKVRKAELRSLDIELAWDRAAEHGDGIPAGT